MNKEVLHITNKPATLELIAQANIEGDGLAWQDPLYEGPIVPESLENLSEIRARYFSDHGWGNYYAIRARFRERDALLRNFRQYQRIVLWFDHDLQDQLQMLQLLNWFDQQTMGEVSIELICVDHVEGIFRFEGLETLDPEQLAEIYTTRMEVTLNQYDIARSVWTAISADNPQALQEIRQAPMAALPTVKDAISRLIQEYPKDSNGMSRLEHEIANIVYSGVHHPQAILKLVNRREERPYLSEAAFRRILHRLMKADNPLLVTERKKPLPDLRSEELMASRVRTTSIGFKVLAEACDLITLNGIDRWVGGVHLDENNLWVRIKNNSLIHRKASREQERGQL